MTQREPPHRLSVHERHGNLHIDCQYMTQREPPHRLSYMTSWEPPHRLSVHDTTGTSTSIVST
ncbi:unnamed protein product [Staurois parvus]|uniref:Uncharacterized protein n=1 Tax=Staurois parvus TaxID=386267 RepID=A0ABN9GNQ5_9NEOB|nr:unnamed protein product [Staurois parvus]